jgi:hypothetical protein
MDKNDDINKRNNKLFNHLTNSKTTAPIITIKCGADYHSNVVLKWTATLNGHFVILISSTDGIHFTKLVMLVMPPHYFHRTIINDIIA